MPLWFRLIYLVFVVVMVPTYALAYPLSSFLWFSNIALLAGCLAAWLGSRRLASMMLVSVGLIEMGWIVDFLGGLLLAGEPPLGAVTYMFDRDIPVFVRSLSLYHLFLPFMLFWMVWRLGYDAGAWRQWAFIGCGVIALTRLLVGPDENVNFVLHAPWWPAEAVPDALWLGMLMAALTLAWYLTHRAVLALLAFTPPLR